MGNIIISLLFKQYYYHIVVYFLSYLYLFLSIGNHMFPDFSICSILKGFFLLVYNLLIKELPNNDSTSGQNGIIETRYTISPKTIIKK